MVATSWEWWQWLVFIVTILFSVTGCMLLLGWLLPDMLQPDHDNEQKDDLPPEGHVRVLPPEPQIDIPLPPRELHREVPEFPRKEEDE